MNTLKFSRIDFLYTHARTLNEPVVGHVSVQSVAGVLSETNNPVVKSDHLELLVF